VSNVLEDFTDEIIDLYQALKKEKESFADLGIDEIIQGDQQAAVR